MNRPRHAWLPGNESTPLKGSDHLIHRGGRDQEVPLDVGFGWGDTESENVLLDEFEILALAWSGLSTSANFSERAGRLERCRKAPPVPLDKESGPVGKTNREASFIGVSDV
jgi:hypothetical protein